MNWEDYQLAFAIGLCWLFGLRAGWLVASHGPHEGESLFWWLLTSVGSLLLPIFLLPEGWSLDAALNISTNGAIISFIVGMFLCVICVLTSYRAERREMTCTTR